MADVTPRPDRQVFIEAKSTREPAGAARTGGTLCVPFALLKSLLTDVPLKKRKRRRPVH